MTPSPPRPPEQERDLFLEAIDIEDSTARAAFLDRACLGRPRLRDAVDSLLAHSTEDSFLATPAITPSRSGAAASRLSNVEKPGDLIDRYRLLEMIGEGGSGAVFMAEQSEPVQRRVALKVIKAGMDTESVIARFESERRTLALMDHPNIAKVLDAGTTCQGRPYFVMELVHGAAITHFCRDQRLALRDRLRLFIKICLAIQHAHQKGIIHRDIKPSNILVAIHDREPVPFVIDFGIAKAVDPNLSPQSHFTQAQGFVGTPAYMSPEQAELGSADIDTRTDIYSLGVVLYEMLTERTPFDARELQSLGMDAMRRVIREREPLPPSQRIRRLPAQSQSPENPSPPPEPENPSPSRSAGSIPSIDLDLDWIILKSLEKDRDRRYATANGLAMDIQRYLADEPVLACPPSAAYRLKKLFRRNRLIFTAVFAFAAALIFGLGLALWQYQEKSAAYQLTRQAEQRQRILRQEAENAHRTEATLRRESQHNELLARRRAYAADINLVQTALASQNLGRALEILDRQSPPAGQRDLRGWEYRYLREQCRSDAAFTLCQRSNEVYSLTASHDGRHLALATTDGSLSVYDLQSRIELARFSTSRGRPPARFSPAAAYLVFAVSSGSRSSNRTSMLRIWEVSERRFLPDLNLAAPCQAITFAPDGRHICIITADNRFSIRSFPAAEAIHGGRIDTPISPFSPILISDDFQFAAFHSGNGTLTLYDLQTSQSRWSAKAAEETLTALSVSADGRVLASGAGFAEPDIRLWNVDNGHEIAQLQGHRSWVSSLVFLPRANLLVSGSADQTICLWDLGGILPQNLLDPVAAKNQDPPEDPLQATLRGHRLEVWSLALIPGSQLLASGSKDGAVCVWDFNAPPKSRGPLILSEALRSWQFSADSQSILAVNQSNQVVQFQGPDFQDRTLLFSLPTNTANSLISPGAATVAVATLRGTLQLWEAKSASLLREWRTDSDRTFLHSFRPGTSHLLTRKFGEGSYQEWNSHDGKLIHTWQTSPPASFRQIAAFSPSSSHWIAIDPNGNAKFRREETGEETLLDLEIDNATHAAFAPNTHELAIVSSQGVGQFWKLANPLARSGRITGFLQGLRSVAYSQDGSRLLIGSDGREAIKLWDAIGQHELITLAGSGSGFNSAAFSPDGTILGARNSRGFLHLWQAR